MIELAFPLPAAPDFGQTVEVAPGILWLRLPLPFRLNHVNVYLLEETGGWTVVDTGVDDARTRALWAKVLAGPLQGRPVTRVVVTHFHPDHVGAAAFLCERTGAVLHMGETEYLTARANLSAGTADIAAEQDFYRGHGLSAEQLGTMAKRLDRYRAAVPALPRRYAPLRAGDRLRIGARDYAIHSFAGHSPAQMLLHAPDGDLLIAADHVLAQISPNVSVAEEKPLDDPLGLYLDSFDALRRDIPASVLVLPGHRLPFRGLHARLDQLDAHHAERCALIVAACGQGPALAVADLVPVLFSMQLDAHQLWFAFSEALAHVNYLAGRGRLAGRREHDGVLRWSAGP